jgi:hypothetical protein
MAGKMPSTGGLEAAFRDMDLSRRIDSELTLTIHGDLGMLEKIFSFFYKFGAIPGDLFTYFVFSLRDIH